MLARLRFQRRNGDNGFCSGRRPQRADGGDQQIAKKPPLRSETMKNWLKALDKMARAQSRQAPGMGNQVTDNTENAVTSMWNNYFS